MNFNRLMKLMFPKKVVRVLVADKDRRLRAFYKIPKNGKIVIGDRIFLINADSPVLLTGNIPCYLFRYDHVNAVDMLDPEILAAWTNLRDLLARVRAKKKDEGTPEKDMTEIDDAMTILDRIVDKKDLIHYDPFNVQPDNITPDELAAILNSSWLRDIVRSQNAGMQRRQLMMIVVVVGIIAIFGYFLYQKIETMQGEIDQILEILQNIYGG